MFKSVSLIPQHALRRSQHAELSRRPEAFVNADSGELGPEPGADAGQAAADAGAAGRLADEAAAERLRRAVHRADAGDLQGAAAGQEGRARRGQRRAGQTQGSWKGV